MRGANYRLVHKTTLRDGSHERYFGNDIYTRREVEAQLAIEAFLHTLVGWTVSVHQHMVVCVRKNIRREVRAIEWPMGDVDPTRTKRLEAPV